MCRSSGRRVLPVVELGRLIGMITITDILTAEVQRSMATTRGSRATVADAMTPCCGPAGAYQLFVPWQPVLAQVRAVAFHVPFAIFTSCTPLIWRSALTMFMPASTTSA
jgi:hypothetical protein